MLPPHAAQYGMNAMNAMPPNQANTTPKKSKMKRARSAEEDEDDGEIPVANAEPTDDVNYRNKLFSDAGNDGYENDEISPNKTV